VTCFLKTQNIPAAADLYFAAHPDERATTSRRSLKSQIKRVADMFLQYGSVKDRPRCGRPPTVPDEFAEDCAVAFMAGYCTEDGQHMWYTSVREACMQNNVLKRACLDFNVSPRQLLARMRQVRPDLQRRKVTVRKPLTNRRHNAAAARLRDATVLLAQPWSYFKRIMWLDAASFFVIPDGKVEVWASSAASNLQRTDVHLGVAAKDRIHIKYYAMVNALVGAVAIVFITGTTGVNHGYTVSSSAPSHTVWVVEGRSTPQRHGLDAVMACERTRTLHFVPQSS